MYVALAQYKIEHNIAWFVDLVTVAYQRVDVIAGSRPKTNGAIVATSGNNLWHTRVKLGSVDKVRMRQNLDFTVTAFLDVPHSENSRTTIIRSCKKLQCFSVSTRARHGCTAAWNERTVGCICLLGCGVGAGRDQVTVTTRPVKVVDQTIVRLYSTAVLHRRHLRSNRHRLLQHVCAHVQYNTHTCLKNDI